MMVDDLTTAPVSANNHLHVCVHGVVTLERLTLDFGAARRTPAGTEVARLDFARRLSDLTMHERRCRAYIHAGKSHIQHTTLCIL